MRWGEGGEGCGVSGGGIIRGMRRTNGGRERRGGEGYIGRGQMDGGLKKRRGEINYLDKEDDEVTS